VNNAEREPILSFGRSLFYRVATLGAASLSPCVALFALSDYDKQSGAMLLLFALCVTLPVLIGWYFRDVQFVKVYEDSLSLYALLGTRVVTREAVETFSFDASQAPTLRLHIVRDRKAVGLPVPSDPAEARRIHQELLAWKRRAVAASEASAEVQDERPRSIAAPEPMPRTSTGRVLLFRQPLTYHVAFLGMAFGITPWVIIATRIGGLELANESIAIFAFGSLAILVQYLRMHYAVELQGDALYLLRPLTRRRIPREAIDKFVLAEDGSCAYVHLAGSTDTIMLSTKRKDPSAESMFNALVAWKRGEFAKD